MEDSNSITMRLEAYLMQLSDVNRRWADWLALSEQAAIKLDLDDLNTLAGGCQSLMSELQEMLSNRNQLLLDAASAGLPNTNLQAMARALPAWQRPSMRRAVLAAKMQLANLRRLHAAAWVLIHESATFYAGCLMLFSQGESQQHVYVPTRDADTGGGQLLDANL